MEAAASRKNIENGDADFLKKKGNSFFQKGQIDEAIYAYTSALDAISGSQLPKKCESSSSLDEPASLLLATILSNRAACYLKRASGPNSDVDLEKCVEDCTEALTTLDSTTFSSTSKEVGKKVRGKLLYRRAKARASFPSSDDGSNLNDAAKDLLSLLSFDPKNSEAATLLQSIRVQHGMKSKERTPLTKALEALSKGTEAQDKRLNSLKIIFGYLSNDVASASMDLGRRNGVALLMDIAIDKHHPQRHRAEDLATHTKCRTVALQALSCASSHPPFVWTYATPHRLDQNALASLVSETSDSPANSDVAVAGIALMLRLVINLDHDDDRSDVVIMKTEVDGPSVCRMCESSLSSRSADTRPKRASLDLICAWTASDRDAVVSAADAADLHSDHKAHRKHVTTEEELRSMKPKELAAHSKREYEIRTRNKDRARRNAALFCDEETGGLSALLSCAIWTDDHVLRRELGVVIGRLAASIDDEKEIKKVVALALGCTNTGDDSGDDDKEKGLTIEEVFDEDEEEKNDAAKNGFASGECESKEAEDGSRPDYTDLEKSMMRGQLTASLLLGKAEVGAWALGSGWSDGRGVAELQDLISSKKDRAMAIASEIVSAAASAEKARPLIMPLLEKGAFEDLLHSDDRDVRSGAASAMAKLGLASKELSANEGEVVGLLQVAVELLDRRNGEEDGTAEEGSKFLAKTPKAVSATATQMPPSSSATTTEERGIEVLSYLASKTHIKEEIAHGFRASPDSSSTALERLVELASVPGAGESVSAYGLATIFALISVSAETLRREAFVGKDITPEQYDELQALGKTQEEKEKEAAKEDTDSTQSVYERIRKLANANVPRALVKLIEGASEHTLEQLVLAMNRMAVEESVRGVMVQQGCLSSCIKLEQGENPTESGKKILRLARHCIAKMLITMNPSLLTVSQRMGSVKPLIQLIRDNESTDLAQFEGLLAITNLASLDDETKNRVVSEKGISVLSYAMFSDHDMVRRAATEAMSNLVPHPDMIKHLSDPESLKLWVAFASDYDSNFECSRAAAGCLAMASRDQNVATVLAEMKHYGEMTQALLECGNLELMHRVLVVLLNMLDRGGKCREAVISSPAVAFCRAYVESYHDGMKAADLGFSNADQDLMAVTIDLAKEVVLMCG